MSETKIADNKLALSAEADVSRFLAQATFGADAEVINALVGQDYGIWIDEQKNKEVSLTRPYMTGIWYQETCFNFGNCEPAQNKFSFRYAAHPVPPVQPHAVNFSTPWMQNIVHGEDQLRQRVTWCLSQILVVSYIGNLRRLGTTIADYYDLLAEHALGNYRDLLLEVSLHPGMAYYLTSLGNQKADPTINRYPDENYAREVMQLFTIGLWELNPDGSRQLDGDGEPIPTYNNEDITELARVFTGLWFEGEVFGQGSLSSNLSMRRLDVMASAHDMDAKTVFRGKAWETTIPAGQMPIADIEQAIDILFNHPNTPPFICKQLIQFMVKSHPSAAYVERISNVFIDNGVGVRGDLHAVVKAILLDDEARQYDPNDARSGKLVEPMLRITRLFKAFKVGKDDPLFVYWWWPRASDSETGDFGQWPMRSQTVFNFFRPEYIDYQSILGTASPPINSPELMIINTLTLPKLANYLYACIFNGAHSVYRDDNAHISEFDYSDHAAEIKEDGGPNNAYIPHLYFDFSDQLLVADDTEALIDHLDQLLCMGQMRPQTRDLLRRGIDFVPPPLDDASKLLRVKRAVYLLAVSPDMAILR